MNAASPSPLRRALWRELGLFLAALAVLLQIGGTAAHFAARPAEDGIHLAWCGAAAADEDGQPGQNKPLACPLCQLPQVGGGLPPACIAAVRVDFTGARVEYSSASTYVPASPANSAHHPRAPPVAIENELA